MNRNNYYEYSTVCHDYNIVCYRALEFMILYLFWVQIAKFNTCKIKLQKLQNCHLRVFSDISNSYCYNNTIHITYNKHKKISYKNIEIQIILQIYF